MSAVPVGYTPVPLPSRGLFYDGKVPDGIVHIRRLKVTEEAAIQTATSGLDLVNATVGACVRLPDGMSHLDLLVTDRLSLLVALRCLTFGASYGYAFRCPACGAKNNQEFNLTGLVTRSSSDGESEPMYANLPEAGNRIGLRFLRGKDEAQIARVAKRVAMQSNDSGDANSLVLRKALQILTIDGAESPLAAREAFVRELSMVDSQAMSEVVDAMEPGIDLRLYPECRACGFQTEMPLPFTLDFFRAPRRSA